MKEEILKEIFSGTDYNSYKKMTEINKKVIWFSFLSNIILTINNNPLNKVAALINVGSLVLSTGYSLLDMEAYTKDIYAINALYKEVIRDFNTLNKEFELTSPIEIYASFVYALNKGYLSKDKHFELSQNNVRDVGSIMGANIITGQGVCRHISPMLKEVYNEANINSGTILVETPVLLKDSVRKRNLEIVFEDIVKEKDSKNINDLYLEFLKRVRTNYETQYAFGEKKEGPNHVINFVNKDGNTYFLDPTNSFIFKNTHDRRNILLNDAGFPIKVCEMNREFKKNKSIKKISAFDEKPSTSFEEDLLLIGNTTRLLVSNRDRFEDFYRNNSSKYDEITSKVLKIKRKKDIRKDLLNL